MAKRRDLFEAVLFLPAMALLGAVVFGSMYAILVGGGWLLRGWYWLLTDLLPLPRSLALALAVMAAALCVLALLHWPGRRRRRTQPSIQA